MKQILVLKSMLFGGILGIVMGIVFIGLGSSMPAPVSSVYTVFGMILLLFSILFTLRVNKALKKVSKRARKPVTPGRLRTLAVAALLLLVATIPMNIVSAQTGYRGELEDETAILMCLEMRRRIIYVQYAMLGFLIIAGLLAFVPVILGRTIVGPILADLQYLAGAMFLLLIFALLLIFPLDAMFVVGTNTCTIKVDNLKNNGPPLLRIILTLISPPTYTPKYIDIT